MELQLIYDGIDQAAELLSDDLMKRISKFWSNEQWELYLKQLELSQPEEEIYVGTTSDLEKFAAKNSEIGFVPASSVEANIEFSRMGKK